MLSRDCNSLKTFWILEKNTSFVVAERIDEPRVFCTRHELKCARSVREGVCGADACHASSHAHHVS